MTKSIHEKTPLFNALKNYIDTHPTPFDVPGHKMGNSTNIMKDYLGEKTFQMDVNSMSELDLLSDPNTVIKEAQDLYADAYCCEEAYFLVNGTSVGVQAMIMATCNPFDKIILPRNVHKSVINAIIMSGVIPIFIEPEIDSVLGIANGISLSSIKEKILENHDIKAIFLINPTYFGICCDLSGIVKYAHDKDILVLVDEAHGAHFPFHVDFPISAMEAGADLAAVSIHKTGGSLTQSSVLLQQGNLVDKNRIMTVLNLLQSTSASYLLMASLDVARHHLVIDGPKKFDELLTNVVKARTLLNEIPFIKVLDRSYLINEFRYDLDEMKLVIQVNELGFLGFEIYDLLKAEYNIQMELAEAHVTMAIISIGDDLDSITKLVDAIKDISIRFYGEKPPIEIPSLLMHNPILKIAPRQAFYSRAVDVNIADAVGKISASSIMIYPPGIPLVIPGEIISKEIIKHYYFYLNNGGITINENDKEKIKVLEEE